MDVEVLLERRMIKEATELDDQGREVSRLFLSNGEEIIAGRVIPTISGYSPNTAFLPTDAVTQSGYIRVLKT